MAPGRLLSALLLLTAWAQGVRAGDLPVPDAKSQGRADAAIRSIFREDYAKRSGADRKALAEKLLAEGKKTADDPPARYVLFHQSAEVAAAAGDFDGMKSAVSALAEAFAVIPSAIEAEVLMKYPPAPASADAAEAAGRVYADLLERLIADERYDLAARVGATGLAVARKAHDSELAARIEAADRSARDLQAEAVRFKTAQGTLAANPNSPEANGTVGKFLCFNRDDWAHGLPMLARGSDAALKSLAEKESAKPAATADQVALGDGWYAIAAREPGKGGIAQRNIRAHAAVWYRLALEHLKGLDRLKVDKRLTELTGPATSPAQAGGPPPTSNLGAPRLSSAERDLLVRQRAALLEDARALKDNAKRREKELEAAKVTLQIDPSAGMAEVEKIIADATADNDSDRVAAALVVEGKFLGSINKWTDAEARLSRVWKEYHNAGWGDYTCEAAETMARHYLDMGQPQGAIQYKVMAFDAHGLWGTRGGEAGLWLADYYLAQGDKGHAIAYLKQVIEKCAGLWDGNKKKAKEKLAALGEPVPPDPPK